MIYEELKFGGSMTCSPGTVVCCLGVFVNFVWLGHAMFPTYLSVLLAVPNSGAC